MSGLRTYSHLAGRRRAPSEYEIVTSRLLYYADRGFEVETPGGAWLATHQRRATSLGVDWEAFDDPAATTYHAYVARRRDGEAAADAVLRSIAERGYDRRLRPAWLQTLERVLPTLRFPLHGRQMVEAYVAHAAPSGKLVVLGLFQAGDTMRLVQRLAQRMRMLSDARPGFGDASRRAWESDPAWQPLRKLVETLMVTYDWLEACVALNLAVKPALDAWMFSTLPAAAIEQGDALLGEYLFSMSEDAAWHRQAATALADHARGASAEADKAISEIEATWSPRARQAAAGLSALL